MLMKKAEFVTMATPHFGCRLRQQFGVKTSTSVGARSLSVLRPSAVAVETTMDKTQADVFYFFGASTVERWFPTADTTYKWMLQKQRDRSFYSHAVLTRSLRYPQCNTVDKQSSAPTDAIK